MSFAPFTNAIFANKLISVTGNSAYTDSYNSGAGAYGGANIHSFGDITVDGDATGNVINLDNNADINGDANVGIDGTVVVIHGASVNNITYSSGHMGYPLVVVPATLSNLASSGSITNANVTLTTGSYKYDSITLSSGGSSGKTLTINGDVNLYVTGEINITGNTSSITVANGKSLSLYVDGLFNISGAGLINSTANPLPSKTIIYSTNTNDTSGVKFGSTNNAYACFYAPRLKFLISGVKALFGSMVCDSASVTGVGAAIHYDEVLTSVFVPDFIREYDTIMPFMIQG
jgi:hypothetical protein